MAVVLTREEVTPRFLVRGDDGMWALFVPLPPEIAERERRMRLVAGFMAWKSARWFILSAELIEPDVVYAVAVSRTDTVLAARHVIQKPLSVGPIEWLPSSSVGDEITALLPRDRVQLDDETERALIAAFGRNGEFTIERRH